MRNIILTAFIGLSMFAQGQSTSYEKAWQALNSNKRAEAGKLLAQAQKELPNSQDAYISGLYLASYNGKSREITDFIPSFYNKTENPYPYIYALWFNNALLGTYGKKQSDHQLGIIDQLINDPKVPGTLVAAAHYQKGMHFISSNEFDKAQAEFAQVGNIQNWQYVGPFENLSESGFYKNYGPLQHPEPGATFKSLTQADIKWFTPASEIKDGWTPVCYQFSENTAVVYAQSFVKSEMEQTVLCNAGAAGSIKVWVNDELLIAEPKERSTEMDAYTVKCRLTKGVNRVLVQLGYTSESYPNFTIRFTNDQYRPINGLKGSPVYAAYLKAAGQHEKPDLIPHFAESFFKDKISKEPANPVNYLLLADVYLRNKKTIEARNLMDEVLKKNPANSLVRLKLLEVLLKIDNRTALLEEIEKLKQADPECVVALDIEIKELFNNEKYEDGARELEKRIKLHGEDQTTSAYRILLLVAEKKYDELVKEAEKLYHDYPENPKFVSLMYTIKKEVYKDNKGALKVYEAFMKHNYDFDLFDKYADILIGQGSTKKGLEIKQKLADEFPYDPQGYYRMAKYYYSGKQYDKSEEYVQKSLALAPYNEAYWELVGDIEGEKHASEAAIEAYRKSLKYDPNQYEIINKMRKLNGKSELYKLLPEVDIQKTIKEDDPGKAKNADYGYYFILDQKDVILYPGGATEEYSTFIIRITNEKGVEKYKESSIGYNSNTQTLLIEKAQVIKKSGIEIDGERNGTEIVFTNLEPGDVVVFRYRIQNYVYGRFGKDFWDKYYFNAQIYTAKTEYNLLLPASQKVNYVFTNFEIQPVIKNVENFKQYSWQLLDAESLMDEPLMPVFADVGAVLHVSTVTEWSEIANWYSDLTNSKSEEDFEIVSLYNKLFPPDQKKITQFKKAKIIYDYIESNIRYSSVPFRQSGFVPQRASLTLTTKLGDCKDLSNLFVTLCRMAGISSQMVLVDTRDNGQKDMLLPSLSFNHCIARVELDGKYYFIELTDNYLPFASLPNNLLGAIILEIPAKSATDKAALQILKSTTKTKDIIKRIMNIKSEGSDLTISVKTIKYGNLTAGTRESYVNLEKEKQAKNMEEYIAGSYKNNVKLQEIQFKNLSALNDSIEFDYTYKVKNEVSEIGSIHALKIVYPDLVATLDNFSAEERKYPIEYWSYENADAYETVVNITAPPGKKFIELPASETLSFKDMNYSIRYILKAPDKLTVIRKFNCERKNLPASEYPEFKSFFEKIVKAEQQLVAFK